MNAKEEEEGNLDGIMGPNFTQKSPHKGRGR